MRFRELNNKYDTTSVRKGIIRTTTATDELDSATIVLTHVGKLDISDYDIVELTNEFDIKEYWLVATYERTFVKKTSPQLYDYKVDLMELTKLLEGITLPNMSITNIGQNRTLYYFIRNAFLNYFQSDYGFSLAISSSLVSAFNSTTASECTFSQPTLREYLDFLMEQKGYIAKLTCTSNYFWLSLKSLNPTGTAFPSEYTDWIVESQNASDYVTALTTEAEDIVSNGNVTEYHKLKADDFAFTSSSAKLILDSRPYDIENVVVKDIGGSGRLRLTPATDKFQLFTLSNNVYTYVNSLTDIYLNSASGTNTSNNTFTWADIYIGESVNITDRVVTEAEYNTLETLSVGEYGDLLFDDGKYKNNCIYWSRGNNTIAGLNTFESRGGGIFYEADLCAIEYAFYNSWILNTATSMSGASVYYPATQSTEILGDEWYFLTTLTYGGVTYYLAFDNSLTCEMTNESTGYAWKDAKFKVTYRPYANLKIKQIQNGYEHYIEQANNSTNATTDIMTFYKQEKEKNNQLGNPTLSFYGNSSTDALVFALGQTYSVANDGTYILNKLEYTIKQNIIVYKGTLTKNYSNRNIHTILNREKRYYALPSASQSVRRQEYFTFDISSLTDLQKANWLGGNSYHAYCSFLTEPYSSANPTSSTGLLGTLPVTITQLDDTTYAFSVSTYDNVSLQVKTSDETIGVSDVYKTEYISFVNDDGEASYLRLRLFISTGENYNYNLFDATAGYAYKYKDFELGVNGYWLKDARESLAITFIVTTE